MGFGGPVAVLSLDSNGVAAASGQRTPHRRKRVSGLLGWVSAPFAQGDSLIDLTLSPTSVFRADDAYYAQSHSLEEKPAFQVASYQMDLTIHRGLGGRVTMELEGPELSQYPFTLYHGYLVTKVTDEAGDALSFTREGDYLTVTPHRRLSSVTVEYRGSSSMFYSGSQGVCLPGAFPTIPGRGTARFSMPSRMTK